MEKQFIDLVNHVFTLDWALIALPLSLVLCLLTKRVLPGLIMAVVAVVLHHAIAIGLAGDFGAVPAKLLPALQKAEPISLAAEYAAYAFLIVIFSLTRQDMFRPSVTN